MQVFLSYARSDATQEVDQLRDYLGNARHMSWVDRHDLEGGADWWDKVSLAISSCDAFVLLITPKSVESGPVAEEYRLALSLKKPFFPILVKTATLPADLQRLNYRDLTGGQYTNGLTKLIGDLQDVWDDVRRSLAQFIVQPEALQKVVKDLSDYARLGVRPPEVFDAFRETIANLADSARTRPLYDVLHEFLYPAAAAPHDVWPRNVIIAHWPFFEQVLRPVHDSLGQGPEGEPVPIVLAVMTRSEALELENGSALQNASPALLQQFSHLKAQTPQTVPGDWVDRYGATPEEWTPYDQAHSIRDLVGHELAGTSATGKKLYPKFIDIRTLNAREMRPQLKELRYRGCVVVMDLLSICHPKLHEAYLRSMLCAQERVVLVQMSPFGSFPQLADVTFSYRKRLDLEFWDRFALDRDKNCKRIGDEIDLQRFLSELTDPSMWDFVRRRQP